jgi:hypothetical protein
MMLQSDSMALRSISDWNSLKSRGVKILSAFGYTQSLIYMNALLLLINICHIRYPVLPYVGTFNYLIFIIMLQPTALHALVLFSLLFPVDGTLKGLSYRKSTAHILYKTYINPYTRLFQKNPKLFQLRLSPSKAEKSNTSAKGLLGIAKN